jgi:arsenite methyltransferase
MAIACPVNLDTLKLRAEIESISARVAADPSGAFHFHRGPEYAATRLNYDPTELSTLPGTVTESFGGVGNPFIGVNLSAIWDGRSRRMRFAPSSIRGRPWKT